jgi:hypothetical protein
LVVILVICRDIVSELNCFPFSATALTHDNVLKELKELNWETLCDASEYYGASETFGGVLELPWSEGLRIERMYFLEEGRKSAGVLWCRGGSPPPSLMEATNNTTGLEGETFTSQLDSSICRESDWYVEQCLVLSLTAIQFQLIYSD